MKYKVQFLISLALFFSVFVFGQKDDLPERPNPPRLVNDFANIFSANEKYQLEQKLIAFDDSTSCQIAVVVIPDLKSDDPYDYANRLGRKWGVGQSGKSNGIVILIKPKTSESKGQIFIAPGRGMEGLVTDAIAGQIVNSEMIPRFSQGKMYEGVDAAINVLISLNKGEFTGSQYLKAKHKKKNSGGFGALIIIIVLIIFFIISRKSNGSQHMSGSGGNLPFWLLMGGLLSSGGRSGGSYGDFQSGDSDFGGFGGGDFGGGGAGGSW